MQWFFRLPGTQAPLLRLERSPWTGRVRMYANGREVKRVKRKGRPFVIELADGTTREVFIKARGLDYLPRVMSAGKEIYLDRRLTWFEWLLGGLPFLLVVNGGALGGGLGAVGLMLNLRVLRSRRGVVGKG
ncbi:MAG TPA: hypothetical protein VF212_03585 [Longimicrobiales bacterium]